MFSRLKLYTVHTKAASNARPDRPVFVGEGFSFLAFVFTFLWALYYRCYRFAAIIILANIGIAGAAYAGFLNAPSLGVAQIIAQFLVGCYANDFRRARLMRSGYVFQDITSGDSLLRAEQRYFDRIVRA